MSRNHVSSNSQSGFTLIEILLALSIFAVLLTFLLQFITRTTTTQHLVTERQNQLLIGQSLLNRLHKELQLVDDNNSRSLMPIPLSGAQSKGRSIYFRGMAINLDNGKRGDTVSFLAVDAGQSLPGRRPSQGVMQITYRVAPDPDNINSFVLVRDETPFNADIDTAMQDRITFPIAHNLLSFQMSYLHDDSNSWRQDWGSKVDERLPHVVSVVFTVAGADGGPAKTFFSTISIPILN